MNVKVNTFVGRGEQGRFIATVQTIEDIDQVAEDIKEFLTNELYEAEENAY